MKFKLILSCILLIIGTILSAILSTLLHFGLKFGSVKLEMITFHNCITSLAEEGQHLALFLCLLGLVILLVVLLVFVNQKGTYESDLKEVVSGIRTPTVAGQAQHGSARWLSDREKKSVFDVVEICEKNEVLKELMEQGEEVIKDKNQPPRQKKRSRKKVKKPKVTQKESEQSGIQIVSSGWDHSWLEEDTKS